MNEAVDLNAVEIDDSGDASREDLVAVAEAAMAEEPDADAPAQGAPVAKPAKVQAEAEEPSDLEKLLAERETKAKERTSILDGAEKAREKMLTEARAEMAKERAEHDELLKTERAKLRFSLSEKPLERLRELGTDPKRLIEDALREEDPNYRQQRALETALAEERSKREAIEERIKGWDKQTADLREQQEASARSEARKDAETQLLELAKARGDHADMRSLYGQRDKSFILSAHAAADELRELMVDIGRGPKVEEVVEYMAREARKERAAQLTPAGLAQSIGNAPKVTAKQTTLGAQDASVRRASVGDFSKLTPEEQRADLIALANETMAKA